jgi:hypothetical protein
VRSFLTLGAFATAMLLSIRFPLYGLGLVWCLAFIYGQRLPTVLLTAPEFLECYKLPGVEDPRPARRA